MREGEVSIKSKVVKDIKNLSIRFIDDEVLALSSQLAYSLIFSFFPFIIFLMTVIGVSSINSSYVLEGLTQILPHNTVELIENIVIEVVDTRHGHLLSLSLIITIWSASTGLNAVIRGINKAYSESEKRSFIKVQLIAILSTLALTFIILVTILVLVFGEIIGKTLADQLGASYFFKFLWNNLRYFIMTAATIFIFAALYRYTPCRRLTWKEVVPGAVFSTITLAVVSLGFAYYVNNFSSYSRVYGSIGTVIVLLTWLFLLSIIIIMGGELNATLAFDREGKEKAKGIRY